MKYSVHTCIKNDLIKKTLVKGTLLSACGMLILTYCLIYLKADILEKVGFIAYLVGGSLVASGLIPFRTLSRLQLFPHRFEVDDTNITYIQNSVPVMQFTKNDIASMEFVDTGVEYGIGIHFKDVKHLTIFDKKRFYSLQKNKKNFDAFYPYFTKKALTQL